MRNFIVYVFILFSFCGRGFGQSFFNSDLDGDYSIISDLPDGWSFVPYTDTISDATYSIGATPDLTDLFGPRSAIGLLGNPYSGNTFVSGVHARRFQEGIMQQVDNLDVNRVYSIDFYQCVVKQENCLDQSGSWAVYLDGSLLGVSEPSFSMEPFASTSLQWENRCLTFVASRSSHWIKFLPMDDDSNNVSSKSDIYGGLRMGIDLITLSMVGEGHVSCEMPNVFSPNNDGINDLFLPIKMDRIQKYFLSIYNRWGSLVFDNGGSSLGWNGMFLNELCPEGTYSWVIKYVDIVGTEKVITGNLTLLR